MLRIGLKNEQTRRNWLRKTIGELPAGLRILDAGAGELANKPLCSHLEYVSQDICQYDGRGDTAGLQVGTWDTRGIDIVCDITAIPQSDESFDAILCAEVFEHVPDPLSALKEFARLTKPGGTLIVTAPFCSLTHFAPYHFSSGFNSYWYKKHLKDYGFEIVELSSNGNWFEYIAQELWRLGGVGSRYSSSWLGYLAMVFSVPLLLILSFLSKRDQGSDELLCFGWHVVARKLSRGVR